MTKAQEIEMFKQFLAKLPADSYLADIFAGSLPVVESTINNDFAHNFVEEETSLKRQLNAAEAKVVALEQKNKSDLDVLHSSTEAWQQKVRELNEEVARKETTIHAQLVNLGAGNERLDMLRTILNGDRELVKSLTVLMGTKIQEVA